MTTAIGATLQSVYVHVVGIDRKRRLLVMLVCFHGRHSSSESDTGEKKRKKRGKEQLDRSERQK